MQHLDEGTIHAWLDGALDAEEAAGVEQHAAACAECAAAIAEARGLAAGASRILASLDNVPAGVIPRTSGPAESFATRRSRSLWNTLHLTPARAAAAALVFVAGGAALVVQHRDDTPAQSPVVFATFDTTNGVKGAVAGNPIAKTPPRAPLPIAAPIPRLEERKAKPRPEVAMDVVAPMSSRRTDSISGTTTSRLTNESANSAVAAPSPRPMAIDAAKSAVAAGAVTTPGAALRSAEPPSARSLVAQSRRSLTATVGCYSVGEDSLPLLPRRIILDTGGIVVSVPSWHWSSRAGGINLEMMTPSAATVQLDSVASSGDLRGAMSLNGRQLTVLLRRVDCPATR